MMKSLLAGIIVVTGSPIVLAGLLWSFARDGFAWGEDLYERFGQWMHEED